MSTALAEKPTLTGNPGVVNGPHWWNTTTKTACEPPKELNGLANIIVSASAVYTFGPYQAKAVFYGDDDPLPTPARPRVAPEALAEAKAAALEWINMMRLEWCVKPLKALPKGRPGDTGGCVIAEAIPGPAVVGANGWVRSYRFGCHRAPEQVQRFIKLFDSRMYPELIA